MNRQGQLSADSARMETLARLEQELCQDAADRAALAKAALRIHARGPRIAAAVSALTGSSLLTLPERCAERAGHVPERMLR